MVSCLQSGPGFQSCVVPTCPVKREIEGGRDRKERGKEGGMEDIAYKMSITCKYIAPYNAHHATTPHTHSVCMVMT